MGRGRGGVLRPVEPRISSGIHELVLTMDALYAPSEPAVPGGQVGIWLDGRRVLAGPSDCHPTTAEQVILGYNLIGGSTAAPVFRGAILGVQTVAPAELDRMAR